MGTACFLFLGRKAVAHSNLAESLTKRRLPVEWISMAVLPAAKSCTAWGNVRWRGMTLCLLAMSAQNWTASMASGSPR